MVITRKIFQKTSHALLWLVFSFILYACRDDKKETSAVTIQWEGNKARAFIIPNELLRGIARDSAMKLLHVRWENAGADMLGEYSKTSEAIVFTPLIGFSPGLNYRVEINNKLIGSVRIPVNENAEPPGIVGVYPSGDVPENLLKIYVEFSKPMQEGQAINNIIFSNSEQDSIPIFLDLQHELWNKEGTILTLWLDPGRIKRGLQPNERLGSPLQKGQLLQLQINSEWRDAEGLPLMAPYVKLFGAKERDNLSPSLDNWKIHAPKAETNEALKIELNDQLDYLLLKNTISIIDKNDSYVGGTIEIEGGETAVIFKPIVPWSSGTYTLQVESRLEDLAGNNLNRLFDTDISTKKTAEQKPLHKKAFHIQ